RLRGVVRALVDHPVLVRAERRGQVIHHRAGGQALADLVGGGVERVAGRTAEGEHLGHLDLAGVAGRLRRVDQEVVLALDPLAVVDEGHGRGGGGRGAFGGRGRAVVVAGGRGRGGGCRAGGGRRGGRFALVMAAGGKREQGGAQDRKTLEHDHLESVKRETRRAGG